MRASFVYFAAVNHAVTAVNPKLQKAASKAADTIASLVTGD